LVRPEPAGVIRQKATLGLTRYADSVGGAITERDRRIIAALRTTLNDSDIYVARDAAVALAEFLPRDESVRDTIQTYCESQPMILRLPVARAVYRNDPGFHEAYLEMLIEAAQSGTADVEQASWYFLKELGGAARPAVERLVRLRNRSPQLASEINDVVRVIDSDNTLPASEAPGSGTATDDSQ
jgi:hypothetical protein